ncbi:MAG: hypothetical protein NVS1B10_06300 [Candidatus Saccharimonadales bacterium]
MPLEIKSKTSSSNKHFERLMLAVAIFEPITTLPQIYEIWVKKMTAGVSLATWFFYTLTAMIWFIYGLKIKDRPVTISSLLWIISEGFVVLGLLIFK